MRRLLGLVLVVLAFPASASAANTWSGTWDSTFGAMTLTQSGGSVEGNYTWDQGHLTGTVSGDTLSGMWDEAPTRTGGVDAGPYELTMASDGRSFTGHWRHNQDSGWWGEWSGTCTTGACLSNGSAAPPASPPSTSPPAEPVYTPPGTFCEGGGVPMFAIPRTAVAFGPTCATRQSMTADEKLEARADLRVLVLGAAGVCGAAYGLGPSLIGWSQTAAWALCVKLVEIMGDTLAKVHDPPAATFGLITVPARPRRVARAAACPKGVSKRNCSAVRTTGTTWRRAIATTVAIASADAQTVTRFTGAVAASDPAAAFAQAALHKVLAGQLAYALDAQETAGRAYGSALRRAHLDVRVSAARARRAATGSRALTGAVLQDLVDAGLAPTPAAARALLVSQLKGVHGAMRLSQVASVSLPTDALVEQARSITMPDLAALVTAMGSQGMVSASTRQTLMTDLGTAATACRQGAATQAAMERFRADAESLAGTTVGSLLSAAAMPLVTGQIPTSAC